LVTATPGFVSQNKLHKPINKKDAFDRTAAMLAAQCGQREALKLLLQAGADVGELKDQNGQTVNDMLGASKPR